VIDWIFVIFVDLWKVDTHVFAIFYSSRFISGGGGGGAAAEEEKEEEEEEEEEADIGGGIDMFGGEEGGDY